MKVSFFFCAVFLQMASVFGYPSNPDGVGAFAYQDSTGNRYGGTYELNDGKVTRTSGNAPETPPANIFGPNFFPDWDDFFPSYFKNFENLLQEAFKDHIETQQKALGAAEKAYQLTSNQAGHLPQVANRFNNNFNNFGGGFNNYGNPYGNPAMNAAYAGAFGTPTGYSRQIASISPSSPYQPNVDEVNYGSGPGYMSGSGPGYMSGSGPGYVSVGSKSYASSMNINGKQVNHRGSETYVDQNGKVTSYKVAV